MLPFAAGLGLLLLAGTLAWGLIRGKAPTLEAARLEASIPVPAAVARVVGRAEIALPGGGEVRALDVPAQNTTPVTNGLDYPALMVRRAAKSDNFVRQGRKRTEDDLVKQVQEARQLALDNLAGLPLRQGEACQLTRADAAALNECAAALRGKTEDAGQLTEVLSGDGERQDRWLRPEAVPALAQMLTAGPAPVREVLLGQLSLIEGKQASEALARLALFDLRSEVREGAVRALEGRPSGEYAAALLKGFEHPWPPVANHAAEALVNLRTTDALPALVRLLDAPDPRATYRKAGDQGLFLKEMVRIHHRQNCLLCHPQSFAPSDSPRAVVPSAGDVRGYYGEGGGTFVRADITYIRQDFSVVLPTGRRGGPRERFDFVVRERVALDNDRVGRESSMEMEPCEQREAVLFTLRQLTGQHAGRKSSDWEQLLRARRTDKMAVQRLDRNLRLGRVAGPRPW